MHAPQPSSIHLHSAHFNLHPAPSASPELISASVKSSATLLEPKYRT